MPTDELDEEFEEELTPELDEEELDEEALEEEELEDDEDFVEEVLVEDAVLEEEGEVAEAEVVAVPAKRKKPAAAAEEDDDEEELDPDDVEADLDTILKDRIAAADDLEDEEEDEEEEDFTGESTGRVQPKTDSEFVCKSCFLVKRVSQRVPGTDDLCSDCV